MIKNKINKIKKKYSKKNNLNSDKKIWLYGYHSVKAALENINRKKYQLICTKNALDKLGEVAKNLVIQTTIINSKDFDKFLSENSVHQGLALEVEPLQFNELNEILLSKSDTDVIIVLDRIKDPQNVGAIIRSAEILGCKAIIGSTYHCAQESGSLVKAASGAFEKLPYLNVTNISNTIEIIKKTVLFEAIKSGQYLNSNKIQLIILF